MSYIIQFMQHPVIRIMRHLQFYTAIAIYCFAALMTLPVDDSVSHSDIVLHAVGNFLLVSSAFVAFGKKITSIKMALAVITFAVIIELCQGLTPSRTVDTRDIIADIVGILIAYIGIYFIHVFSNRANLAEQV